MGRLTAIILGSAAGGGFPQWNCFCPICRLAWAGDKRVKPRTQSGLAVSADGRRWVLLNASPDLRAQLQTTPELQPRHPPRDTPISAVILTGAEIDQITGLLTLRERQPFALYGTSETLAAIAGNPMFGALAADVVDRATVASGRSFVIAGMEAELFNVPGKVPLYLEGKQPEVAREDGVAAGVAIRSGGAELLYVPGAAAVTAALRNRLQRTDVIFFDGTLFTDDEMITSRTGNKTGRRMGHMPMAGDDGSLAALAGCGARRIYVHINNTNPVLVEGSPERSQVIAAGWEIGEDGMRIVL